MLVCTKLNDGDCRVESDSLVELASFLRVMEKLPSRPSKNAEGRWQISVPLRQWSGKDGFPWTRTELSHFEVEITNDLKDAMVALCTMGPGDWYVHPGGYEHDGVLETATRTYPKDSMDALVKIGLADVMNPASERPKYRLSLIGGMEVQRMFVAGEAHTRR